MILCALAVLTGCGRFSTVFRRDLTDKQLEAFFRMHTVSGNHAVAAKKLITVPESGVSYLATFHGYADNLKVCKEVIAPLNNDPSLSVISGTYFCEALR